MQLPRPCPRCEERPKTIAQLSVVKKKLLTSPTDAQLLKSEQSLTQRLVELDLHRFIRFYQRQWINEHVLDKTRHSQVMIVVDYTGLHDSEGKEIDDFVMVVHKPLP